MGNFLTAVKQSSNPYIYYQNTKKLEEEEDGGYDHKFHNPHVSEMFRLNPGQIVDRRRSVYNVRGPNVMKPRVIRYNGSNGDVFDANTDFVDYMRHSASLNREKIVAEVDDIMISGVDTRRMGNITGGPYFVKNHTPNTINNLTDVVSDTYDTIKTKRMDKLYYKYEPKEFDDAKFNFNANIYDPYDITYITKPIQTSLRYHPDTWPNVNYEVYLDEQYRHRYETQSRNNLPNFDHIPRHYYS